MIALVIVGREITISALREWMAQIGASKSVAVNSLGKFKTVCQMVAIPMLLFYGPLQIRRQRCDRYARVGPVADLCRRVPDGMVDALLHEARVAADPRARRHACDRVVEGARSVSEVRCRMSEIVQ